MKLNPERLRGIRRAKGIKAKDLSSQVGISAAYLCQLEADSTRNPTDSLVEQLAAKLEIPIKELTDRSEFGPNKKSYNLTEPESAGWLVRESFAEYLAVTDLEKALDRAREARDWKAVCALGCELARKTEKEKEIKA